MHTTRYYRVALICFVAAAIPGIPMASSASRTARQSHDDALARPVTVELERVYLGELVEKLAKLSGADLRLAGRTAESADPLCVSVRDMPVRQVMDLLTSLYTYKGGAWEWLKETGDRGDRYTLTPSQGARTLITQLETWTFQAYIKQLDTFRRTRDMTPEEQARLTEEDTLLPPFPAMEITRGDADLFLDVLTDDQRLRVLRGEDNVRVPVQSLPASGRKFLDSIYAKGVQSARQQTGTAPDLPPFEWVEFQRTVYPGYATADVRVCIGDKIGMMSNSVLGGKRLNAAFKKHLRDLWLGSGDTAASAASQAVLGAPDKAPARPAPWTLGARLVEASRASGIPILCRMSHQPAVDPGTAVGKSLSAYLADLDDKQGYMSKWHSPSLLLSTYRWHLPEESSMSVDLEVVKGLKAEDAKNDGILSVADLAATAHRLTVPQLAGLAVEWPVFRHIARYQPIFSLCGSSPLILSQATSERGYPTKDSDTPMLMQCAAFRRRVSGEGGHALRITERRDEALLPPHAQTLRIELKGPDGQWTDVGSFYTLPRTDEAKSARRQ